MAIPDFLLDKRVVRRNVAKGLVTKDQVESYIASLPDVEDQSEPCTPDPEPTEEVEGAEEAAEGEGAEAAEAPAPEGA